MMKLNLVLIPALFCNYRLFTKQVEHLSNKYNIIIADNYNFASMASLADNILEKAPPKFALGGISMGGYIAFEIMRREPERVEKLILMNTSARADTSEQSSKRIDAIRTSEKGFFLEVIANMFPFLLHQNNVSNQVMVTELLLMAQEIGCANFINQVKAIMTRIDSRPFLSAIKCPTLVLGSRDDKAAPLSIIKEIHQEIKHSKAIIIEECGHLSPLEKPNAVSTALWNFLNS